MTFGFKVVADERTSVYSCCNLSDNMFPLHFRTKQKLYLRKKKNQQITIVNP